VQVEDVKFRDSRNAGVVAMKSAIVKRSVVIGGQKTSVSLEDSFWTALKEISRDQKVPLYELIGSIDARRSEGNLSSAIRLFVLNYFRDLALGLEPASTAGMQASGQPRIVMP
jgi:predicted DNA-binding ribbon-helix-helix protein